MSGSALGRSGWAAPFSVGSRTCWSITNKRPPPLVERLEHEVATPPAGRGTPRGPPGRRAGAAPLGQHLPAPLGRTAATDPLAVQALAHLQHAGRGRRDAPRPRGAAQPAA